MTTGDAGLDQAISDLLDEVGATKHRDLLTEILVSAVLLAKDPPDRLDLKIVNAALQEMRAAFSVFAPYADVPKVTIFGSARTREDDPLYTHTRELARELAGHGWMVVTGAGPGIMAAGMEGAGVERSIGVLIRLPFEGGANELIAGDDKLVEMRYFFTRKLMLVKESAAFVAMPGGFGTLDETFELLTLVQTGKSDIHPVVLLEPEGSTYWQRWLEFMKGELLDRRFIKPADLSIFCIARTPAEALEEIETFYSNYRSARFIGERLVLRLNRAPDPETIERLEIEFADLLDHGSFEVIAPTSQERRDEDELEAKRLAFYPRHEYGRIRQLIDALNRLPVLGDVVA